MEKPLFSDRSVWIWMPEPSVPNAYREFRETFWVEKQGGVTLHISVEGAYAVFLNGEYIPSGQYPDFPHYKAVQTPDLTKYVCAGENELLIQVWYPGRDTLVSRIEQPGARYEVWQEETLLCASSPCSQVRPIAGYRTRRVSDMTPQLGAGFCFRNMESGVWRNAVAVEKTAELVLRPVQELEVADTSHAEVQAQGYFVLGEGDNPGMCQQQAGLYARELSQLSPSPCRKLPEPKGLHLKTEQGDGIYVLLDLEDTTSGYLVLDIVTPEECRVDVGFGEHLEDLRVRTSVGGRCFAVSAAASSERCRFVHRFRRIGCRYLQLFLHTKEAVIYEAGLLSVTYPVHEASSFCCGDHLHNQIYKVSRKTLHACMHDHYEDCPWREQALYGFDSRNQMLAGYYTFGDFDYARENLRLLALSQRPDGLLEMCAPARADVNIPSFSLSFIVALEEYCRYSGDLSFGVDMLPVAERILQSLLEHVHDGVVHNYQGAGLWNFYEWSSGLDGMPMGADISPRPSYDAGLQLFGILALQRMETLSSWLGQDISHWMKRRLELQKGLEVFWNAEQGAYAAFLQNGKQRQYSELIQNLALYTHSCPEDRAESLRARLQVHNWEPTTLSFSIFRYEALLQEPEKYGQFVFREIAERWGRMLYQGASAFWETDLGAADFEGAGSLCHGWSGIPIYFYGAYVLGVRPVKPGVWRPQAAIPTGIGMSKGRLKTPEGELEIGSVPVCPDLHWFCLQKNGDKIYF